MVREPLRWVLEPMEPAPKGVVLAAIGNAARGPACDDWDPPAWVFPHQVDAARRLAGALRVFRGALLADATGLGKTYVALSVATRYRAPVVLAPAALVSQWRRVAAKLGIAIRVATLEQASRAPALPRGDLVIVDEAHHLRNPDTRRYEHVAKRVCRSHTLLLTATPVANGPRDLVALLRLFLADNALAFLGVNSIEEAVRQRRYNDLARAASVLCVARSPDSLPGTPLALPRAHDIVVPGAPVLRDDLLRRAVDLIDTLQFPGAARDADVANLLRLHLVHRLASSTAALRETVDRHLRFVRRATEAARIGQALPRNAARALLGPEDESQLSFDLAAPVSANDAGFGTEQERLEALRDLLPLSASREGDKVAALVRLLDERAGRKTIVFTAARATALSLAAALSWRRVAVTSGSGGVIASGSVPLDTALAWFAPHARDAAPPPSAAAIDTLIATDLVSEGLDLQDADAIVHFDLPWTPLRLTQRLGRIVRLGGAHRAVSVWWFLPTPPLDARLRLVARIAAKALAQRRLGTDAPKRAGNVSTRHGAFHWKESLVALADTHSTASERHRHAVKAPPAAAFALHWSVGDSQLAVPEVLVPGAGSLLQVSDTVSALQHAPSNPDADASPWQPALRALVRQRLAAATEPACNDAARSLTRTILRLARLAARRRDPTLMTRLDAALARVRRGLPVGPERALATLLRDGARIDSLDRWLAALPPGDQSAVAVRLAAALIGAP